METIHVDLKPNKSLIDYDFEKYQLTLDKLKVRSFKLDKGISEYILSDKQYSFQHFTAFGINNHLHFDQWNKHHIYWINKNEHIEGIALKNVHDVNIKLESKIYLPIPQSDKLSQDKLNLGINFASHNYLFLSDGLGSIYLVYSGDRGEDNIKWKILLKEATLSRVEDDNDLNYSYNETKAQPSIVLHSINRVDEATGRTILECLSLSVQEQIVHDNHSEGKFSHPPAHKRAHLLGSEPVGTTKVEDIASAHIKKSEKHATHFVTILQWDTYLGTDDGLKFVLDHRRILEGLSSPNYAAIEQGGQALHLLSDMPFKFVYDSKKLIKNFDAKIASPTKNGVKGEAAVKHIDIDGKSSEQPVTEEVVAYYWSQTETDLTLKITLPDNTTKEHIIFHLEPTSIKITMENKEEGVGSPKVVLDGSFRDGHKADVANSTWILVDDGKCMEVTLCKNAKAGHDNFAHSWPNPPLDSTNFPGQMDPDYYKSLLDKMDAFTTEGGGDASYGLVKGEKLTTNQASSEDNRPLTQPYNMQELEDCDAYPQDTSLVGRYCGSNHCISHQASLSSNKYLFTCTNGDAMTCPAFALRYDVHATIWQPLPLAELEGQTNNSDWDEANLEILPNQPVSAKLVDNSWINVGALNAFGYVLASKESRKFIGTSPDPTFNYAAVSDSSNHVFIYWHVEYDASKSPNKNVLRNRKSGKVVEKISKQQVVTLGLTDQENLSAGPPPVIMGMVCLKDNIAVLTNNALYIIFLN